MQKNFLSLIIIYKSPPQKQISSLVAEYFDHGDTHETYLSLEELQVSTRAHLVLVTAVELAMDHKPSHREMTSVLLADLYGHLLFEPHYTKGILAAPAYFLRTEIGLGW